MSPALAYIQSHYAEKITEAELAKLCGMSKFRFSRTFREQCGVTFRECLLQWRVMKAAELLENPTLTITQVSFMVGFNDLSHFAKMFRRYFGRTASAYRQRLALRGSADDEPQSSPLTNPVNVSEGGLPLFLSHYDA